MDLENAYKIYYRDIFPLKELFKILEIEKNREISFFTPQKTYLRYLSFDTPNEFIEKIQEICPLKMDVGAFYDVKPTKGGCAVPIRRELVFDIDLTDYPRNCCSDKTICEICYEKIKCAIKLLNYILKNEFGFEQFGFVFSGRRGVHCWAFDHSDMHNSVRGEIYKYIQKIVDKNISIKEYDDIMQEFGSGPNLIENFFIRLDKQVTVFMGHLVKMPFSIHPETGKISVPLDPNNITELKDLPTLENVVSNPEKLKPYIDILKTWRI